MRRKYLKTITITFSLMILSCAREPGEILLNPPGEEFKTQYHTMQLVGDFNGWALGDLSSTKMELVSDWTWQKIQYFSGTRDSIMFKIVPNGNWDLAFGTQGKDSGLSGYAEPGCTGTGNHITAGPITKPGYWKFTFNEQTLYYSISFYAAPGGAIRGKITFSDITNPPYPRASISVYSQNVKIIEVQSDTLTSEYIVSPIPNGTYVLIFEAGGYVPCTVSNVVVSNDTVYKNVILEKAQGIIIDGNLSDWDTFAVYDTIGDSPWGLGGDLGSLYARIQHDTLFLGVKGSLNNNALIVYFYVEPCDSSLGYSNMDNIDFYPRKFTFPDTLKAQYILAQWIDGNVSPGFRSISATGKTTDLTDSIKVASTLLPGEIGAIEAAIPLPLLSATRTGRIGVVAVVAGGDHYDGPESVPSNNLQGNGTVGVLTDLYFLNY